MRGRVEIVRDAMKKIDWECMQEDIDLEAVVVMSEQSEVWQLKAMERRNQGQLEESEGDSMSLIRKLQEEVKKMVSEEEWADRQ